MSEIRTFRCPGCGQVMPILRTREFRYRCPRCHGIVILSRRHLLTSYVLGFVLSLGVAELLRLTAAAALLWVVIFIPCFIVAARLTALVMSPYELYKYDAPPPGPIARNIKLFLGIWFGIVSVVLLEGYVLAWVAYMNGSRRDLIESMQMWSTPLDLVNRAFVVTPEQDLVKTIGIVTANGYFWALALTLIFKFVHSRMRRNRVTELAISGSSVQEKDDGL